MDKNELDLGPIEAHYEQMQEDYYIVTNHPTTLNNYAALVSEVKRLRAENAAKLSREEINALLEGQVDKLYSLIEEDESDSFSIRHYESGIQALGRFRSLLDQGKE